MGSIDYRRNISRISPTVPHGGSGRPVANSDIRTSIACPNGTDWHTAREIRGTAARTCDFTRTILMDTDKPAEAPPAFSVFNYCVCFLDILGQRHALRDQGLLPWITTEEQRLTFVDEVLKKTIRPITRLQTQTNQFVETFLKRSDSQTRQSLPPDLREEWDKVQEKQLCVQYWSDGLVAFSCLGNKEAPVQINGAFALIGMAGSLCLMNLGHQFRNPIRGGIEIAWGTELRPGELYGPAIARSYELESEVAQYPRIAVGARMIEFLKAVDALPPTDKPSRYSATMAKMCLQMLLGPRRSMDNSLPRGRLSRGRIAP